MTTSQTKWQIGDIYYQGHGLMLGRDVDDSATDLCETEAEAQQAIDSEWLSWLSSREREGAETYVRKYEVISVDDDGTVSGVTCD